MTPIFSLIVIGVVILGGYFLIVLLRAIVNGDRQKRFADLNDIHVKERLPGSGFCITENVCDILYIDQYTGMWFAVDPTRPFEGQETHVLRCRSVASCTLMQDGQPVTNARKATKAMVSSLLIRVELKGETTPSLDIPFITVGLWTGSKKYKEQALAAETVLAALKEMPAVTTQ